MGDTELVSVPREPTEAMVEAMARALCIAEGYHKPDEDWARYTNGVRNAVVPDIALERGKEQRWRCYVWKADKVYRAGIDAALSESIQG